MSDKYTSVEVDGGGGLGLWGHIPADEAIAELRRHYEQERDAAERALLAIDAGAVSVWHQYGPYAARDRRRVDRKEDDK